MFFVLQAASDIGKKAEDTKKDNQNERLQNFPSYLFVGTQDLESGGFQKSGYPQIIHFNRGFPL